MQIPSISSPLAGGIQSLNQTPKPPAGNVAQPEKTFEQVLSALNQSQQQSDDLVQKLSLGENVDLHQVMIGLEENDVNFRVALAIRDRLVDAYREVMRMQI